jgi:uncharacterized sporulation protein YeaH/YhbH (DUF444 family)
MTEKITESHRRFKNIVRGRIRKQLRKYISSGELLGRRGDKKISIPMPSITIPRFTHGEKETGGVGQGPGEPGDGLGGEPQSGSGSGAGDQTAEHALEVEFTPAELAAILGEELELPRIEPKGTKNDSTKNRYTSIRQQGPESLRHFGRTFRRALKRQISSGLYNPKSPLIALPEDRRYRSAKQLPNPHHNAVIFYIMDISGSMGEDQREIVRIESYWIDTWLQSQYDGLETRYIVHDSEAEEVDENTFFRTKAAGGTIISSAYELLVNIIDEDYPPSSWNIYPFHFSDGDNLNAADTEHCIQLLNNKILPIVNLFCYGQVRSPYGSAKFRKDLNNAFLGEEKLILSNIKDRDDIMRSIKEFLGTGK